MTAEEKAQKILLDNISTSEAILIEESETLPERILVSMVRFAEAYHQHKLKEVERNKTTEIFNWIQSDNCWIEDKSGNKLPDAVICGKSPND